MMQAVLGSVSQGRGHMQYDHHVGLSYAFERYAHPMQQKDDLESEEHFAKDFPKVNYKEKGHDVGLDPMKKRGRKYYAYVCSFVEDTSTPVFRPLVYQIFAQAFEALCSRTGAHYVGSLVSAASSRL